MNDIDRILCVECGRAFTTLAGRELHRRRAHPLEFFRERQREPRRVPWTEDEKREIARLECQLPEGMRPIEASREIARVHGTRCVDSIRKLRKTEGYRICLEEIRRQLEEEVEAPGPVQQLESNRVEVAAALEDEAALGIWPPVSPVDLLRRAAALALRLEVGIEDCMDSWLLVRFPGCRIGEEVQREMAGVRNTARRRQRTDLLSLWKRDRRAAVEAVMGERGADRLEVGRLEEYWRPVMEARGTGRQADFKGPRAEGVVFGRISVDDVKAHWPGRHAAPGPDAITPMAWKWVPPTEVALFFNLMVWLGRPIATLRAARTTFVPKKPGAEAAAEFRPITVSSVILRHFHKILAARVGRLWPNVPEQMGFKCGVDGVANNVFLLDGLLQRVGTRCGGVCLALVDMAKAFDRVDHEALFKMLVNRGVEEEFVEYLKDLYNSSWTMFVGADGSSGPVVPGRGVRQGDPLSGPLFNVVMDHILTKAKTDGGIVAGRGQGREVVHALAYADDVVLVASNRRGLQVKLDAYVMAAAEAGLSINPEKTVLIPWKWDGRRKAATLESGGVTVDGHEVFALEPDQYFKYLGVKFSPWGVARAECDLRQQCVRLDEMDLPAPVKLLMLAEHLIPAQYHALVLGARDKGTWIATDRCCRRFIRKWCELPHDAPNAAIHAALKDGGLGVPSLEMVLPELRYRRRLRGGFLMERDANNDGEEEADEFRGHEEELRGGKVLVRRRIASELYGKLSCAELKEASKVRASTAWIRPKDPTTDDRDWRWYLKVWFGALPAGERLQRGRRVGPIPVCRHGCRVVETINHAVQKCRAVWGGVILRHHSIVKLIDQALVRRGWTVGQEVVLNVGGRVWRPDLIVYKINDRALILDVQVVTGRMDLAELSDRKAEKYARDEVREAVAAIAGVGLQDVSSHAVTITWRGVWCRQSADTLLALGVPKVVLEFATERVLKGTLLNWRSFSSRAIQGAAAGAPLGAPA